MLQTIGEKVRALRKSRNVSQEILCGTLNMPLSTYSNKERLSKFTTKELQVICTTLNCPYDIIISDKPFNPMQLNFEHDNIVFVNQNEENIPLYQNTESIFLTDKEKKLLKFMRTLTTEKRNELWDYIEKLKDGEQ